MFVFTVLKMSAIGHIDNKSSVQSENMNNSHEYDVERFPSDLFSSTKHGDLDHTINEGMAMKDEDMKTVKMTSTGSVDMVSFMSTQGESNLQPESPTTFIKDFEITEKHGGSCLWKCCFKKCGGACKKNLTTCKRHLLTENNSLSPNAPVLERLKYKFLCPPHGCVADLWTVSVVLLFLWTVLWAVTGKLS